MKSCGKVSEKENLGIPRNCCIYSSVSTDVDGETGEFLSFMIKVMMKEGKSRLTLHDTVESSWDSSLSKFHSMEAKIYKEFTVGLITKLPVYEDFSTLLK